MTERSTRRNIGLTAVAHIEACPHRDWHLAGSRVGEGDTSQHAQQCVYLAVWGRWVRVTLIDADAAVESMEFSRQRGSQQPTDAPTWDDIVASQTGGRASDA